MAKQIVNIGTVSGDGTGDAIRIAFDKINDNADELYAFSNNATTTALSLATLNSTYPSVRVGHQVFCESIIGGALVYTKSSVGWVSNVILAIV